MPPASDRREAPGALGRLANLLPLPYRDRGRVIARSALGTRLATGLVWSVLGSIVGRLSVVVSGVVLARLLGKSTFGALAMVQSTVVLFGTFAGFGMGMTATKYVAEFREKDPVRAGSILALSRIVALTSGTAATGALYLLAPWLAVHSLSAPSLAGPLRATSVVFLLLAINGVQQGALAGIEAFRALAWVNMWTGAASLGVNAVFVVLWGFDGAVWGLVASALLTCLITAVALRRESRRAGLPLPVRPQESDWGIVVRYSVPAVLSQAVVGPVRWVCNVMLVNTVNGFGEMAVFNVTMQWSQVLMFLSTTIANVSIPILSERLGQGDQRSSVRVLKGSIAVTLVMAVPIVVGGSLASPWIMGAYGSEFRRNWPTLVVSFVTAGLMAIEAPVGTVVQASGRMWWGAWMNFGWSVALIALAWVALPLGALGLALATLGAYAIHGVWTAICARRILLGEAQAIHAVEPRRAAP